MSEDRTRDLPDAPSFEERVFNEFAAQREFNTQLLSMIQQLSARLTTLEDKVERRLQETRPIWEAMQAQLNNVHTQLGDVLSQLGDVQARVVRLESKFDEFDNKIDELALDIIELRGHQRGLHKRVNALESPQPPQ
ncbi:MAG: hypothetical protein ABR577_13280 [Pyrinomonadaceae bacterium]